MTGSRHGAGMTAITGMYVREREPVPQKKAGGMNCIREEQQAVVSGRSVIPVDSLTVFPMLRYIQEGKSAGA